MVKFGAPKVEEEDDRGEVKQPPKKSIQKKVQVPTTFREDASPPLSSTQPQFHRGVGATEHPELYDLDGGGDLMEPSQPMPEYVSPESFRERVAEPISLPRQLGLDAVKLHLMKRTFFESTDDMQDIGMESFGPMDLEHRSTKELDSMQDMFSDSQTLPTTIPVDEEYPPLFPSQPLQPTTTTSQEISPYRQGSTSTSISEMTHTISSRGSELGLDLLDDEELLNLKERIGDSKEESSDDRLLDDCGLISRHSFRSSWSPNGQILFSNNSQLIIQQCPLEFDQSLYDSLLSSLRNHFHHYNNDQSLHQQPNENEDGPAISAANQIPQAKHLTPLCDAHIASHSQLLLSYPDSTHIQYNLTIWHLIKSLWSPQMGSWKSSTQNPNSEEMDIGRSEEAFADFASDNYAESYARRAALSSWLEETVKNEVKIDLENISDEFPARKIFILLSGHQIAEACELADACGDVRLALLLAQAGEDTDAQVDLQNQILQWKTSHLWDLIDDDHKEIYRLLSGDSSLDFRRLSWLRAFGMKLWYGCPASTVKQEHGTTAKQSLVTQNISILHALQYYDESVKKNLALSPYPPHHQQQSSENKTIIESKIENKYPQFQENGLRDARYEIIRLYCDCQSQGEGNNESLPQLESGTSSFRGLDDLGSKDKVSDKPKPLPIFIPQNASRDPLDYSLAFHLLDVLQWSGLDWSLRWIGEGEGGRWHQLWMNFASELEHLGLYEWAIYIIKHVISTQSDKFGLDGERIIKEILFRNSQSIQAEHTGIDVSVDRDHFSYTIADTPKKIQLDVHESEIEIEPEREKFLTHSVNVPLTWIHQAKACRARSDGFKNVEVYHLLEALKPVMKEETELQRIDTEEGRDLWRYELRRLHYLITSHLSPLYILQDKTQECFQLLGHVNPHQIISTDTHFISERKRYVFFHATFLKEWQEGGLIYLDYCRLKQSDVSDIKIQREMKALITRIGTSLSVSPPPLSYIDLDQTTSVLTSAAYSEMSAWLNASLLATSLLPINSNNKKEEKHSALDKFNTGIPIFSSSYSSSIQPHSLPRSITENHRLQYLHTLGLEILSS